MYLIGFLCGDISKLLSSFACGFHSLSQGGGMSGNDSSESSSSGSVLKSIMNLFVIFGKM